MKSVDSQDSKLELYQIDENGRRTQLKEYAYSTEERWIRETVDLPGTGPYRIVFRGTVVERWTEHIGLDDIDIFQGNCSEHEMIVFTFETEDGWANEDGQMADWIRQNGSTKTEILLPNEVHTILSGIFF
ncbi:MAM and LDL-receptor class A domain-containing protein 1-like [Mytilus californianus]|uniref:MAM and LDL-receptor class A domain-containing protein 1-like n=1 Tax=Mytilus californianus TaxID=6549 RepID=UPI002246C4B6|nr:MAM and LDL-receptor class A domain-containing protein 1-like [Mytilus californianus]